MPVSRRSAALAVILFSLSAAAEGRVVSYAPLTARTAIPAVQGRLDRRFLLIERVGFPSGPPMGGPSCFGCYTPASRLVLYDSAGIDDPRDVSPGGEPSRVTFAASFEEGGSVRLLAGSDAALPGEGPQLALRILYSPDTGTTWIPLSLPAGFSAEGVPELWGSDVGGWVARERSSAVRLGTSEVPFVFELLGPRDPSGHWGIVAVEAEGEVRLLATLSGGWPPLVGADPSGARFLVMADEIAPGPGGSGSGELKKTGLFSVDLSGGVTRFLDLPAPLYYVLHGWTAADGSTYLEYDAQGSTPAPPFSAPRSVGVVRGGTFSELVTADRSDTTKLFAVPSAYWRGAWILKRDAGPTVLMSHGPKLGLRTHWSDVTRPEVEALHVGVAGTRLLIQVHRPRLTPERRFIDPALAVWAIGQGAPKQYDELFLNEQWSKGFVHLDVDESASGAPFVFDSGSPEAMVTTPGGPSGGGPGGADVVQEWGVVRGSLRQQLLIPAAGRAPGVYGSAWRTDLILRNPDSTSLELTVRLLANPDTTREAPAANLVLSPKEIRLVHDALKTLFGLEKGSGALLLVPAFGRSVDATSRTYSASPLGTFGMGVGAVDLFASASPNFPVTFCAGLLGPNFRTNVVVTDTSGYGSKLSLGLAPASSDTAPAVLDLVAPRGEQLQLSGLGVAAGLPEGSRGSVRLQPSTGQAVAGLIAIDNLTNDPTWFGPDLPATVPRSIPALVHTGGAGGAAWRSDLYLFNPTDEAQTVTATVRDWQSPRAVPVRTFSLFLLPQESRVIRDALWTAFGMTGVAQLSFQSGASPMTNEGVRATSRTYTIGPDGSTYGHTVPALNSFQSVTAGETLEILGPVAAHGTRTNLALVDLLRPGADTGPLSIHVEIVDSAGQLVDSFWTPLFPGGGVQLNDLFNARGLPEDLGPVLIRVSPSGGMVAAYATTVDGGTNDPTYFQAELAASD